MFDSVGWGAVHYDGAGLGPYHAVVDILSRRGPRPLPLKAGQWNEMRMTRDGNRLRLRLNNVEVMSRKMDHTEALPFGFYHDQSRCESRIRSVMLTGDWPEELPQELLAPRKDDDSGHG